MVQERLETGSNKDAPKGGHTMPQHQLELSIHGGSCEQNGKYEDDGKV